MKRVRVVGALALVALAGLAWPGVIAYRRHRLPRWTFRVTQELAGEVEGAFLQRGDLIALRGRHRDLGASGKVQLWALESNGEARLVQVVELEPGEELAGTPRDADLIVSRREHMIRLRSATTGQVVASIARDSPFAVSPSADRIAFGVDDEDKPRIEIVSVPRGEVLSTIDILPEKGSGSITSLRFSWDGSRLGAVRGPDFGPDDQRTTHIWTLAPRPTLLTSVPGSSYELGRELVRIELDEARYDPYRLCCFYSLRDGSLLRKVGIDGRGEVSPSQDRVGVFAKDAYEYVSLDGDNARVLRSIPRRPEDDSTGTFPSTRSGWADFSPNVDRLAVGHMDGQVEVWELEDR
jgi:WD40 repeat protein